MLEADTFLSPDAGSGDVPGKDIREIILCLTISTKNL